MAKLTRVKQKIFAVDAPLGDMGVFGSAAEGAPQLTDDPELIQSLNSYEKGWNYEVLGPLNPLMEDRNAMDFLMTRQIAYILQQGVAEWDNGTEYFKGSLVNVSGEIYVSVADDNMGNSVNNTSFWVIKGGSFENILITGQTIKSETNVAIVDTGLSGGTEVNLPPALEYKGRSLKIKNSGHGALGVYGNDYGVELIDGESELSVPPMAGYTLFCDGLNWFIF